MTQRQQQQPSAPDHVPKSSDAVKHYNSRSSSSSSSDDDSDDFAIAEATAVPAVVFRPLPAADLARLRDYIGAADAVLVTAGAGMSLDSGLPDYRCDY